MHPLLALAVAGAAAAPAPAPEVIGRSLQGRPIALQRVVYVKRFARESRVGFGSAVA